MQQGFPRTRPTLRPLLHSRTLNLYLPLNSQSTLLHPSRCTSLLPQPLVWSPDWSCSTLTNSSEPLLLSNWEMGTGQFQRMLLVLALHASLFRAIVEAQYDSGYSCYCQTAFYPYSSQQSSSYYPSPTYNGNTYYGYGSGSQSYPSSSSSYYSSSVSSGGGGYYGGYPQQQGSNQYYSYPYSSPSYSSSSASYPTYYASQQQQPSSSYYSYYQYPQYYPQQQQATSQQQSSASSGSFLS